MRLWHALVFLLALAVSAVALAPASFVPQRPGEFAYQRATGSIWDGRYEGVVIGDLDVGEVDARLSPLRLLTATLAMDARFSGERVSGDLHIERGLFGNRSLRSGTLTVVGLPLAPGFALPAETSIEDLQVAFDRAQCRAASGNVETDALQRIPALTAWDGPALQGTAVCRDGAAQLLLSSENRHGEIASLLLTLQGDGAGEWRMSVSSSRQEVAAALQSVGFAAGPVAQEWVRSGELRWSW